jgi:hypothetical protein
MSKQNNSENDIPSALKALRELQVEPSPYLTHRIHANLKAQDQISTRRSWVRPWLWPSVSLALGLVLVVILSSRDLFAPSAERLSTSAQYLLNQPYLIKVDIRSLGSVDVAYAEVQLGDKNIHFSSQEFADVQEMDRLVLAWDQMLDKQYLPIVVQGSKSGQSVVTVKFYDKFNQLISSKEMTLSFMEKKI